MKRNYKKLTQCRIFLTLFLVSVCLKASIAQDRSDIDGFFNAPNNFIVPNGSSGILWKYIQYYKYGSPDNSWNQVGFDDSAWNTGYGGFYYGARTGDVTSTPWNDENFDDSTRLFLRGTFTVDASNLENLMFWVRWDDKMTIYINGIQACKEDSWSSGYRYLGISQEARNTINTNGPNTIAVYVKDVGGGRYFDLGLVNDATMNSSRVESGYTLNPDLDMLSNLINDYMVLHGIPAGVFALRKGNDVVVSKGFGYKDKGFTTPINNNAVMRLASVDKIVTNDAMNKLISDGYTDPDGIPVTGSTKAFPLLAKYGLTPGFGINDSRVNDITIDHLIAFESGLSDLPWVYDLYSDLNIVAGTSNIHDNVKWLYSSTLNFDPGTDDPYVSSGHMLLRYIIHQVTGDLETYLQNEMFSVSGNTEVYVAHERLDGRQPSEPWYANLNEPYDRWVYLENYTALATSAPALVMYQGSYNAVGKYYGTMEGTWSVAAKHYDGDYSYALIFNINGVYDELSNSIDNILLNLSASSWDIICTGVTLDTSNLSLNVDETRALTETVLPVNATNKSVTWSSDNPSIATVSSSGLVTAVSVGSANITVTTNDGGYTATCSVEINSENSNEPVTIEAESFTLTGGTVNDAVWGGPGYGVNRGATTINWVNNNDWVEYPIPAAITNGTYKVEYNISTPSNNASISLSINGNQLIEDVVPNNGQWDSYSYLEASENITIDVTNTTIRLTASGSNAWQWNLESFRLTKIDGTDVTEVTVTPETASIAIGETVTLTEDVLPANADDKSVTWSSSNTAIASVSTTGIVTGNAEGIATITVTTNDGNYTANADITVEPTIISVTGVTVVPGSQTIEVGESLQLTETVLPGNATNKTVTWSSDNNNVATVNTSGSVTAQAPGSAIITVTTNDGGYTATSSITVNDIDNPVVTIEAEDFVETGGAYAGFQTYFVGDVEAINWNQTGDWGDYSVNVPESGLYDVEYFVGTTVTGAAIEFILNGTTVMTDNVANNGNWDDFVSLLAAQQVSLDAGQQTIRLQGAGTQGWEWNMDRFILTYSSGFKAGNDVDSDLTGQPEIYPILVENEITVRFVSNENEQIRVAIYDYLGKVYRIQQLIDEHQTIDVSYLQPGMYILQVNTGFGVTTKRFIKN